MFYAPSFWFRTYEKVLEQMPNTDIEESTENSIVVFYQAEAGDVDRKGSVLTRLVKNIKWLAGKFKTKKMTRTVWKGKKLDLLKRMTNNKMEKNITPNPRLNLFIKPNMSLLLITKR